MAKIERDADGNEVKGFEVRVGGGTSTMPRAADNVWDFARADDGQYIRVDTDRLIDLAIFLGRTHS